MIICKIGVKPPQRACLALPAAGRWQTGRGSRQKKIVIGEAVRFRNFDYFNILSG